MSLESGEEGKNPITNKSEEALLKIITELKAKVDKLESNQSSLAPNYNSMNGMSPEQFSQFLKAAKDKEEDFDEGLDESEIPTDDFIDEGVVFYSPCVGRFIVDDKRMGRRVRLPYNKKYIFFEYEATRRIQQGKYETIAPFSKYTSHSKKEVEWLRTHTGYRILFYESSTEAANADILMMKKLTRIMTTLVNYDLPDIIKRCKEYNVSPSDDPQVMRHYLAIAMAKKEMESEGLQSKMILEENKKENLLK